MTLTLAGNKQLMAKRSTSIRGTGSWKTAETSSLTLNSAPILPPGYSPKMTSPAAAADLSVARGTSGTQHRSGMSAAPIVFQASSNNTNSIATGDCPMNIVSDTPEPYLEPIKLLNKQSIEERQQNPVVARPLIGVPSEKSVTLKQLNRSCFTGTRFPSASSRPIPPPKVLLKRQQSTREEVRKTRPSEEKTTSKSSRPEASSEKGAKRRELAYLIVDLQTGRSAISTKNKRTLDDSDVGLRTRKHRSAEDKSRCPVRSFTMSIPGDQVKRPVVKPQLKPRPTRNTSQDSLKASSPQWPDGIATIPETTTLSSGENSPEPLVTTETNRSHDLHHRGDLIKERPEIYVSTSTGDLEDDRSAPPPIPPKRGLGKMVSLPPSSMPPATARRLQRNDRTSLPASSITKDLQQVTSSRSDVEDSPTSSTEKPSSVSHPKPTKNRLPPPKPRPYSERVISPPPPPSFPPPPRPVPATTTSNISQPMSPPAARRATSPVLPPKSSKTPPPSSLNTGMRLSHSHQSLLPPGTPPNQAAGGTPPRKRVLSDSKSNKSKSSKPPLPSRPPPANSKLSQLISEHRNRSKSTVSSKGYSPPTTSWVKLAISEPRLISTTMRSDSQSLTDLRIQPEPEIEDDIDLIPCSNISYVSSNELFGGEDHPSPLYEDIDSMIPLPPPRNEVHKPKSTPPMGKKSLSADNALPELPPKNCYLDYRGRRKIRTSPPPLLAKSPLTKALSTNTYHSDLGLSSPESPTDKELREIEEENRDTVEPYYVKKMTLEEEEERQKQAAQDTGTYEPIRSPLSVGEEGPQEPDVGGVDEYVTMGSVISGAWETDDSEKAKTKEDHPEESYVEMQPVAVSYPNSPSPSGEDISRNTYELDDEPEPVYIEMNPEEYVPPNKPYYASKDLLSHRPDLQAKKKKAKKLFHIGRK